MKLFYSGRVSELEKQMAFLSERWRHRDEEYGKMLHLVQDFQGQMAQMSDKSDMLALIKNVVGQHAKEVKPDETTHTPVMRLEQVQPAGNSAGNHWRLLLKYFYLFGGGGGSFVSGRKLTGGNWDLCRWDKSVFSLHSEDKRLANYVLVSHSGNTPLG